MIGRRQVRLPLRRRKPKRAGFFDANLGNAGFTCPAASYIVQWRILNVLAFGLWQSSDGAARLCY
jgi:hypothetical protein